VLAHLRALEKVVAVQPASQDKMPRQQRARLAKNAENLVPFVLL